jgi:glutamate--cysteine ligase
MAVASRLAVTRVSPADGARPAAAAGRRSGLAVVRLPPTDSRGRRRRRCGAVAASPPTEEVVQMTEPLTKEDLVAYLVSGCKPKENWRLEASICTCSFICLFISFFLLLEMIPVISSYI